MSEDRPEERDANPPEAQWADEVRCDVLVVVVNRIEKRQFEFQAQSLIEQQSLIGQKCIESKRTDYEYLRLSNPFSKKLQMIQVGEGVLGEEAAIIKIYMALQETRATHLMLVGMAFAYPKYENQDPKKPDMPISLGDVLVSQGVISYDKREVYDDHCLPRYRYINERKGKNEEEAKDKKRIVYKPSSHEFVQEVKRSASQENFQVHAGWMITGSAYIASASYRDHLRSLLYDKLDCTIVGGEMEGGALLSMPKNILQSWLILKGVSDYADGQTRLENKVLACDHAAKVALHWFENFGQASNQDPL
jgi:nucleoside phosphorylase